MLKIIKKYVMVLVVAVLMSNTATVFAQTEQDTCQSDLQRYAGIWVYGAWQFPEGDQVDLNRSNLNIYHVYYANESGNNIACFMAEEHNNGRYDTYKILIYRGSDSRVYMKVFGARSGEELGDGIVKIEG